MPPCLIGLGSNLADRNRTLDKAVASIADHSQIRCLRCSHWHETTPIGGPPDQSAFLNGVLHVETSLSPNHLLRVLASIETAQGRTRRVRWAQRTLDLDLLLYAKCCVRTPQLEVPHPRMLSRTFVMEPAVEIAPHWIHPWQGITLQELWNHTRRTPPYVALCSSLPDQARSWVERVSAEIQVHCVFNSSPDDTQVVGRSNQTARSAHCIDAIRQIADFSSDCPTISDFWLGDVLPSQDSRAVAREPRRDDTETPRPNQQRRPLSVPKPRLIVMLDSPRANPTRRRQLLRRLFAQRDSAILRVPLDDPERALQDVVAAVIGIH